VSREGIILERLVELVDVAEEGLWLLYAATWASDLAASERPRKDRLSKPSWYRARDSYIGGEAHAFQSSLQAQVRPANAHCSASRPIGLCSARPFRSLESTGASAHFCGVTLRWN
jgi:hypothetical protein